jgi:phosphate-selective porin OprO/OprP
MTIKTALCAGTALCVSLLAAGAASAQDTTVAWKGAPQWTNDDVQFKVRGRILFDYIYQDVKRDAPLADSTTTSPTRPRAAP